LFFQHKWLKHVHVLLLAIYILSRLVDSFWPYQGQEMREWSLCVFRYKHLHFFFSLNSNISGTTIWMCKEKSWTVNVFEFRGCFTYKVRCSLTGLHCFSRSIKSEV
jgi:hypothetical protein